MSWNYRIVIHDNPGSEWLGLHEVYYNEDGKIYMWDPDPEVVCMIEDGVEGLEAILGMMLNDVERSRHDLLVEAELPK